MNLTNPIQLAKFAASLQRKHTDELGFLPTVALREYAERGQIIPARENDEPIGYVLYFDGRAGKPPAKHPHQVKLHQVCVQYDARGILHGTQLVREVERRARQNRFATVTAWVASDLEANKFWRAIGYKLTDTRQGGKRRNRIHNLWIHHIGQNHPDFPMPRIANSPIEHHPQIENQPAIGAPTSTWWAGGSLSQNRNLTGASESPIEHLLQFGAATSTRRAVERFPRVPKSLSAPAAEQPPRREIIARRGTKHVSSLA